MNYLTVPFESIFGEIDENGVAYIPNIFYRCEIVSGNAEVHRALNAGKVRRNGEVVADPYIKVGDVRQSVFEMGNHTLSFT